MRKVSVIFVLFFIMMMYPQLGFANTDDWGASLNVSTMKEWKVSFTEQVDPLTINEIKVFNEQRVIHPTTVKVLEDGKSVLVSPKEPYEEGALYTLEVTDSVKSVHNKKLKANVLKSFTIESSKETYTKLKNDVGIEQDLQLISKELNADGTTTFVWKDVDKRYKFQKGDQLIVEDSSLQQSVGVTVLSVKEGATYNEITAMEQDPLSLYEELWINESISLGADDFVSNPLAGYIVEESQQYNRQTQMFESEIIIKFKDMKMPVDGKEVKLNGEIKFTDLKLDAKVDSKLFKLKEIGLSLSGKMERNLEIQYNFLDKSYKTPSKMPEKHLLNELNREFIEIDRPIPQVPILSVGLSLDAFLNVALTGGAALEISASENFEFGFLYKNGKSIPVEGFDASSKEMDSYFKGHAELEAFTGIRGELGLQGTMTGLEYLTLYTKVGPSFEGGLYLSPAQLLTAAATSSHFVEESACYDLSLAFKGQIGAMILPKWEIADVSFDLKTKGKGLSSKSKCEIVKNIEVDQENIQLLALDTHKIKVHANIMNLKDGDEKKKNVTKDSEFQIIEGDELIQLKGNEISVKPGVKQGQAKVSVVYVDTMGNKQAKEVSIQISYSQKASLEEVEAKKKRLLQEIESSSYGYGYVQEIEMIEGKTQFISVQYEEVDYRTSGYSYPYISKVNIHEYKPEKNSWEIVYSEIIDGNFSLLKTYPTLFGNSSEQAVLYLTEGNGGYLSFVVIGSKDQRNIEMIIDESNASLLYGDIQINGDLLAACESSQGLSYSWNGTDFTTKPHICQASLDEIGPDDLVLYYTIDSQNNVKVDPYNNGATVTLKKGAQIVFIRNNLGPLERVLFNGNQYVIVPAIYELEKQFILNVKYE